MPLSNRDRMKIERHAMHYSGAPLNIEVPQTVREYFINVYSGVYGDGSLHYSPKYRSRASANWVEFFLPYARLIYRIHVYPKTHGSSRK